MTDMSGGDTACLLSLDEEQQATIMLMVETSFSSGQSEGWRDGVKQMKPTSKKGFFA